MKKILTLLLVLLTIPPQVFAYSKNEVLEDLKSISNIMVSDDIEIINTIITNNQIKLNYDLNKLSNRYPNLDIDTTINYELNDKELSFEGGSGIITNKKEFIINEENISSYYLYLILYNNLKLIYDKDFFFSKETITERLNNLFKEELSNDTIILNDNTNYFQVIIKKENNNFKYYYSYNYTNEYINQNTYYREVDGIIENPYTGNFKLLIGIMLIGIIVILGYTIIENERKI